MFRRHHLPALTDTAARAARPEAPEAALKRLDQRFAAGAIVPTLRARASGAGVEKLLTREDLKEPWLATTLVAAGWLALLVALLPTPTGAAADSEPGPTLGDTGPAPAAATSVTPSLTPAQALSSGYGIVAGLVVNECGVSPLAGCQGQAVPGVELRIRAPSGELITNLRTADDGAFWAPVPPGSYLVENVRSVSSIPVDVRAGEMVEVEVVLPRLSQQP